MKILYIFLYLHVSTSIRLLWYGDFDQINSMRLAWSGNLAHCKSTDSVLLGAGNRGFAYIHDDVTGKPLIFRISVIWIYDGLPLWVFRPDFLYLVLFVLAIALYKKLFLINFFPNKL